MKEAFAVAALAMLSLPLFSCLKVTEMRLFTDESIKSSEPAVEYYIGRHRFSVPQSMRLDRCSFSASAPPEAIGKKYGTREISIEETPWKPGDTREQFIKAWKDFRDEERRDALSYYGLDLRGSSGSLRYAENLDARTFFGHEAVTIATTHDFPYSIHTFIALPQGLLKLTEERSAGGVPVCTEIEPPAAFLLKHYRWGKRPPTGPNVFYTALGMLEGYPATQERATIVFRYQGRVVFSITSSCDRLDWGLSKDLPTEEQVEAKARSMGISYQSYISRERQFAGQTMLESIYRAKEKGDEDYQLFFLLRSLPRHIATPEKPELTIDLTMNWEDREKGMEVWNTVLHSFRLVAGNVRQGERYGR